MSKWIDGGNFLPDGRFCGTEWESLQRLTTFWRLAIDESTDAMKTISYAHHEVHAGSAYIAGWNDTLGINGELDVLLVTADVAKRCHLAGSVRASGEVSIGFYEDTVTSDDGTSLTVANRRRDVSKPATALAYHTPTVSSVGTQIGPIRHVGAGRSGGEERAMNEFILKPNSKYLLRTISESNSNDVTVILDWYEHTDHGWWNE